MKKTIILLMLVLFVLCGCGNSKEEETNDIYYEFTDSVGKTVTLSSKPEKVAVLFSSLAQIYDLAGGEISISVGDSVTRGFVSEDTVLVNETAGLKIDFEKLVNEKPDLVIVSSDLSAQVEAAELMYDLGIPAAQFKDECFEDYMNILYIMCHITGNRGIYKDYGEKLNNDIGNLLSDFNSREHDEISYLFIRAGSSDSSTRAKTAEDHFACVMLEKLGARNVIEPGSALTESISVEHLLVSDPDIILIAPQGNADNAKAYVEELFSSEGYKDLPAIKNGNYVFLDKELFNYKPNQNWLVAYKTLINILYGE